MANLNESKQLNLLNAFERTLLKGTDLHFAEHQQSCTTKRMNQVQMILQLHLLPSSMFLRKADE
jgi:hypothetical protein